MSTRAPAGATQISTPARGLIGKIERAARDMEELIDALLRMEDSGFNIDSSVCPKCGTEARVIANIEEPISDRILARLKKKGALPPLTEWWAATRASPDSSGLA